MKTLSSLPTWSEIRKIGDADVSDILQRYPGIPDDYLVFLREVGCGDLGIVLYEEPVPAYDIYPEEIEELDPIIIFGDDFQGYCFGFDTNNGYQLVEVEPPGKIRVLDRSFKEHVFKWLE